VDRLSSEKGDVLYQSQPVQVAVTMSPGSAEELRQMMRDTVRSGTSRKSFRDLLRRKQFADIDFGGKTGSLRGLDPDGKCDWFVGYGSTGHRKIAVAALTVNEKKWRVKSSYLARSILERYFRSYQISMQ
jgi:cell division protein FtsI/penicillin-binding protein 2